MIFTIDCAASSARAQRVKNSFASKRLNHARDISDEKQFVFG